MQLERVDVVVVGAGWNGLIAAKTYLDFAPDANLVIIDDQATIGGVWSAEKIYPSLYAQIKFGQFEYSFYPMKREGITKDGYIAGQTIHRYLNDFAHDFGLTQRTRLRTKVDKVEKLADGWKLELEGKAPIECAKLIYASGATSHPVIPQWPRDETFNTPIIHSSEVGTHLEALKKVKRVTVVGAAKSAYDTVFLLLERGIQVDWIIRADGTGPLAIMPPTILGVVNTMDVVATKMMRHLGSSIMSAKGPGYRFFNRTRVGRVIAKGFWKTVTAIAAMHAGYDKSENAAKLKPLPVGNGIFWANAGLGCASVPNFWKVFHAGDCTVHRTEIGSLTGNSTVTLLDQTKFETDYIILCTGFDKSYHQFSEPLQQACGLIPTPAHATKWDNLEAAAERRVDELLPAIRNAPAGVRTERPPASNHARPLLHGPSRHYRRLIMPEMAATGDRSVYFPGFIHTIYTPLVSEVQSLWGVAFLLDLVDLPSQGEMEREVAEWNVWTRKRYLAQGRKHAYAIYDFFSYIDVLLEDLGINTTRKSNAIAELLLPKYPSDYKGLTTEFRAALAKKKGKQLNGYANGHSNGHATNGHANGGAVRI
ncbi:cofactor FMO1 FAD enzyme [Bombardia bombarda]|uniref:Cofactor FMO1 FAD enzyme n=1 Tax=Bombardia bombarda TaxID=252184 RepID=A0AA39XLK1_9PEZI|nr:cofactor FMO1 FAD enzyme [Bombardia bombarda]